MSKSDGKVVLSTKLDTSGIKEGSKNIKSAVSDTKMAMKGLASTVAAAFSVSAVLNFSKEAGNAATQVEASISRLANLYGDASEQVSKFIDANARALGMSKGAAAEFSAVYGNLFSVWADQQENALLTTNYLNMTAVVASKTGRTVEDTQERIRSGLLGNTEAIEDLGIFVNVKTIEMTAAFKKMANGRSWEQLSASEQQQVRTLAILEQATQKYGIEVSNTSALTRSQYQAAYEDFQNTWGQVVNMVLLPVLSVLTKIFNVAISGMQSLFGLSDSTSSAVSEYSQNIEAAAENQSDLTKEVEATAKALTKSTAGFDEIQTLSSGTAGESNTSANINLDEFGIGEIGSAGNGTEAVGEVESNLAAIMVAIGGALAAVGVILLFSGQLAWGIGFVIAGAATLGVGAAAVSGDTVSTTVMSTLTLIMGAIAGALVAIGVILIMVGSTALGIGFIAAGAALLGVTIYTITQFSADPIKDTLLMIEAIAGGAMLALGILLLYFGVNKPLAIGLIVAGVGVLAVAVAQIVAGAVSEEVAAWIYGITAIVSTALLVIGIIMLCTGHITPLSIGLVVAGAAGLATTVAINWDSIVEAIRGPIGKITAIVSAALLVLGIILLFVPGAQGLGLGLLIGGAAGLATVVAFNWDSILDSIKGVWQKIKDFWNNHIAQIFTGKFWTDLAKKCGNGLIVGFEGAINGIISLFETMINWVVGGLNKIGFDVPDWVPGIGGKRFGFSIPEVKFGRVSIPRLAKGAVIPPNREFMAVLGDQRHGTNIEAPLDTIKQALAEVMATQNGGDVTINFTGDLAQLARVLKPVIDRENRRVGGSLIKEVALG